MPIEEMREEDVTRVAQALSEELAQQRPDAPDFFALAIVAMRVLTVSPPAGGEVEELRAAVLDVLPEMQREHDAGDGHFSTSQINRIIGALAALPVSAVPVDGGGGLLRDGEKE